MPDANPDEGLLQVPAFELASRQASLAFERTLVTLDQSLMGAIRTSLSLIGFGFAMVLFVHEIGGKAGIDLHVPARNFGFALVAMGTALVASGLFEHGRRSTELLSQMQELRRRKLLMESGPRGRSPIAIFALLLLLSGILVMLGILIRIGPFG